MKRIILSLLLLLMSTNLFAVWVSVKDEGSHWSSGKYFIYTCQMKKTYYVGHQDEDVYVWGSKNNYRAKLWNGLYKREDMNCDEVSGNSPAQVAKEICECAQRYQN